MLRQEEELWSSDQFTHTKNLVWQQLQAAELLQQEEAWPRNPPSVNRPRPLVGVEWLTFNFLPILRVINNYFF